MMWGQLNLWEDLNVFFSCFEISQAAQQIQNQQLLAQVDTIHSKISKTDNAHSMSKQRIG